MLLSAGLTAWFFVIGTATLLLLLIFFFLLFVQYNRRKLEHFEEVLAMQKQFQQTLIQSQLEIQEQVFTEISQEIHDNIGQVLSLARLHINTLGAQPSTEKIDATDELLGRAIGDLRNLSHMLNSDHITHAGFSVAVEQLLQHLEKSGRYTTRFRSLNPVINLEREQSIILFRIIQEIINNIVKHAKASNIAVDLSVPDKKNLRIMISDDGIGFKNDPAQSNGIGIRNIMQRAKMIDADVTFEKGINGGTTVTVQTKLETTKNGK